MDLCKILETYETDQDQARLHLYDYFPKLFRTALKRRWTRYNPWFAEYDDYFNESFLYVDAKIIEKIQTEGKVFTTFSCKQTISWLISKIVYSINDLTNEKSFLRTTWDSSGAIKTTRCTQAFDGMSLEYVDWEDYDVNDALLKKLSNLSDEYDAELSLEDKFSIALIEDIIKYLNENEKKIILGIYKHDIKYEELAKSMDISRQQAWTIGQAARKKIQKYLIAKGIIEQKPKKTKTSTSKRRKGKE